MKFESLFVFLVLLAVLPSLTNAFSWSSSDVKLFLPLNGTNADFSGNNAVTAYVPLTTNFSVFISTCPQSSTSCANSTGNRVLTYNYTYPSGGNYTVSMWINAWTGNAYEDSLWNATGENDQLESSSGKYYPGVPVAPNVQLLSNTWYFVSEVCLANTTARFYVNGAFNLSTACKPQITGGDISIGESLGKSNGGPSSFQNVSFIGQAATDADESVLYTQSGFPFFQNNSGVNILNLSSVVFYHNQTPSWNVTSAINVLNNCTVFLNNTVVASNITSIGSPIPFNVSLLNGTSNLTVYCFNGSNTFVNSSFPFVQQVNFTAFNQTSTTLVNASSFVISNAASNYSCVSSISTGNCLVYADYLPQGADNISAIANGYATNNTNLTVSSSMSVNQTYALASAGLFFGGVFDEITLNPLGWNITLSNSTASFTYGGSGALPFNTSAIPFGSVTLIISNSSYQSRTRFFILNNNTFVNITGYLLSLTQGQFTLMQVLGSSPVNGTLWRGVGGSMQILSQVLGDASNSLSFWVSPAYQYTIQIFGPSCTGNTTIQGGTQYTSSLSCNSSAAVPVSQFGNMYYYFLPSGNVINSSSQSQSVSWVVNNSIDNDTNWLQLNLVYNGTVIATSGNMTSFPGGTTLTLSFNASQYAAMPGTNSIVTAYGFFSKGRYAPQTATTSWSLSLLGSSFGSLTDFFNQLVALPSLGASLLVFGEIGVVVVTTMITEGMLGGAVGLGLTALLVSMGLFGAFGWILFAIDGMVVVALWFLRRVI